MPSLSTLLRSCLKVRPGVSSMFDAPVEITVDGLQPRQRVRLSAFVDHKSGRFESRAEYAADDSGRVQLAKDAALAGSYTGVHPMGLFFSLTPSAHQRKGLRLMPGADVTQPMRYRLRVESLSSESSEQFKGAEPRVIAEESSEQEEGAAPAVIAEELIDRHFVHPHVERTEIETGRVRGTLFMPEAAADQSVPGVIDLYGTGGGLMEHRGALLASKGFAVLSLAYFAFKDLPKRLTDDIQLEYFHEAVQFLLAHPKVMPHGCAMVGLSLGGDIALRMVTHFPEVLFGCAINAFHMLDDFNPISHQGAPLPIAPVGWYDADDVCDAGVLQYGRRRARTPTDDAAVHPLELAAAANKRLLIVVSEDDATNPSELSAVALHRRFARHSGDGVAEDRMRVVSFPGAGHLLEPPYMPHAGCVWHKIFGILTNTGGESVPHNYAQETMWTTLVQELSRNIGAPVELPVPRVWNN